jgi:hypothetical protein
VIKIAFWLLMNFFGNQCHPSVRRGELKQGS